MTNAFKLLIAAAAATAFASAAVAGGGMCGSISHEASVPTETVTIDSDGATTVADSQTIATE